MYNLYQNDNEYKWRRAMHAIKYDPATIPIRLRERGGSFLRGGCGGGAVVQGGKGSLVAFQHRSCVSGGW